MDTIGCWPFWNRRIGPRCGSPFSRKLPLDHFRSLKPTWIAGPRFESSGANLVEKFRVVLLYSSID